MFSIKCEIVIPPQAKRVRPSWPLKWVGIVLSTECNIVSHLMIKEWSLHGCLSKPRVVFSIKCDIVSHVMVKENDLHGCLKGSNVVFSINCNILSYFTVEEWGLHGYLPGSWVVVVIKCIISIPCYGERDGPLWPLTQGMCCVFKKRVA